MTSRAHRTLLTSILAFAAVAVACGTLREEAESVRHAGSAQSPTSPAADYELAEEAEAGERAAPAAAGTPLPAPARLMLEKEAKSEALVQTRPAEPNTEAYDRIEENRFVSALDRPLSTFSIDVDTASYSNVRRFLNDGQKPPSGAVRIEELVNYFDYAYPTPSDRPFSVHTELGPAPWAPDHQLLHIGLQGKKVQPGKMPPRNLVFLVDVSGSMSDENKLPLLRRSFKALLTTLTEQDRVAMVVYAGASGVVLPSTSALNTSVIVSALDRLEAGGSTNGASGIELAYRIARENATPGAVNRVILATDGDFNVGTTSQSELVRLIEHERKAGVYLTVLGFGMGNYKDSTLEKLADHGNGNYAYIDSYREARKVLMEEAGANLVTIAEDVKIQVEFNPRVVGAYRLIGYENRRLQDEDFADDTKDAGEIGAGHTVTALYEIVPPGAPQANPRVAPLKYRRPAETSGTATELGTVKLRYKAPGAKVSQLAEYTVRAGGRPLGATTEAFRFSAAVAGFGLLLRESPHKGTTSFEMVESLARGALGHDARGHRGEFVRLVHAARTL